MSSAYRYACPIDTAHSVGATVDYALDDWCEGLVQDAADELASAGLVFATTPDVVVRRVDGRWSVCVEALVDTAEVDEVAVERAAHRLMHYEDAGPFRALDERHRRAVAALFIQRGWPYMAFMRGTRMSGATLRRYWPASGVPPVSAPPRPSAAAAPSSPPARSGPCPTATTSPSSAA